MDGFNPNDNIVVIAATNRLKTLDSALTRSGRFDLKLKIDLPNEEERIGIINLHLKKV
jgi:ATP-dependent 26S proteasome regulatory subunit